MPVKLKTVVDDISAVPEAYRPQYKADGGKYVLQEIDIPDPVDVDGLVKKRDELLREKKALEARYAGIDPDEYQRLLKQKEQDNRAKLENKGAWEALEQQLKDRHEAEIKNREERIGSLTHALEESLIDAEASAAIATARGSAALLLPHVKKQVKVFEEDGRFVAKVVDSNGNPRIGDAKGSPMTIKQLIEEMKFNEIFGRAFEASYARGSGAPAHGGKSRVVPTITRSQYNEMTPPERAEYFRNKGVVIDE